MPSQRLIGCHLALARHREHCVLINTLGTLRKQPAQKRRIASFLHYDRIVHFQLDLKYSRQKKEPKPVFLSESL